MIDLISEIGQKSKLLDAAVQELGKRGRSYAQSEQEYRIALAKRILDERCQRYAGNDHLRHLPWRPGNRKAAV